MDKFDLYARRNIFKRPTSEVTSTALQLMIPCAPAAIQPVDPTELMELRLRYAGLLNAYSNLSTECRDAELLVKEMKQALYNLQVGSQVLDSYGIDGLPETLVSTAHSRNALDSLNARAEGNV